MGPDGRTANSACKNPADLKNGLLIKAPLQAASDNQSIRVALSMELCGWVSLINPYKGPLWTMRPYQAKTNIPYDKSTRVFQHLIELFQSHLIPVDPIQSELVSRCQWSLSCHTENKEEMPKPKAAMRTGMYKTSQDQLHMILGTTSPST